MKNKIIIALVAVIAWLGQSCETDPAFDFKDDGKIYFKYRKTRPHTDEIRRNNANSWK